MSNGLVLVKNETMAKVYSLNFHLYTDMNCMHFSGNAAVEHFKELIPLVDVLIIDPQINGDNIVEQLDYLFSAENISVPTIVLSRIELETENDCFYYMKDISVKSVIKKVGQVLDISAEDMVAKVVPEKVPLHISYFRDLKIAPCEIFVRDVEKTADGYTYHQLYEKGEKVKEEHITAIQKKEKKSKLFIPKMERLKFVNQYTAQLTKVEEFSNKKNSKDKMSFLQMSRDNIAAVINEIEDMSELMDIADKSINECLADVEQVGDKKLVKYINDLFNSTDSFYLQHAQLSSYIAFKLLKGLNWLSMSQKRTFVSANFFKYILLNSNQEDLAKIRKEEELKKHKMNQAITQEEFNLVNELPSKTAAILGGCDKRSFPENTLTIIREQYGNKAGKGFEQDGEKNLHSLTIAFIISNAFADMILIEGLDDETVIIAELERQFEGKTKFLSYIELLKTGKISQSA